MKTLKIFTVLLLTVLFTSLTSGCTQDLGMETPKPLTATDIEDIIQSIDDRVSWIFENYRDFVYIRAEERNDFYDNDLLAYRLGDEYLGKFDEIVSYDLFYDIDGRLIYAEIPQYRQTSYSIYFHNDTLIRYVAGYLGVIEEENLDDYMINTVEICLENAYE